MDCITWTRMSKTITSHHHQQKLLWKKYILSSFNWHKTPEHFESTYNKILHIHYPYTLSPPPPPKSNEKYIYIVCYKFDVAFYMKLSALVHSIHIYYHSLKQVETSRRAKGIIESHNLINDVVALFNQSSSLLCVFFCCSSRCAPPPLHVSSHHSLGYSPSPSSSFSWS